MIFAILISFNVDILYSVLSLKLLFKGCQSSVRFIIERLKSRKSFLPARLARYSTSSGPPSPFLDNCHQKLIPIHFYMFLEFQFVVISLNTWTQVYFIRMVILKLTSLIEPDLSVSFLLSVRIIEVNNKSNIRKYDKNN